MDQGHAAHTVIGSSDMFSIPGIYKQPPSFFPLFSLSKRGKTKKNLYQLDIHFWGITLPFFPFEND